MSVGAPEPIEESARLCALYRLAILDTPPEESFDRITRLVRKALEVPIALIVLVDAERQWFKSRQGLEVSETPREIAFCAHTILADRLFLVPDAREDARFRDNPLVCGAPNIRFYAGQPLHGPDGYLVGTLCVIDEVPRSLSADQVEILQDLAAIAEQQLSARSATELLLQMDVAKRRFETLAAFLPVGVFEADMDGGCTYTNKSWNEMTGLTPDQALKGGWAGAIHEDDRDAVLQAWREAVASDAKVFERTFRFRRPSGESRWVQTRANAVRTPDGAVVGWVGLNQDITDDRNLRQALEESEQRFRQLAEASDAVFWITEVPSNQVIYVSPAYARIWKRSVASLLADPWDWIGAIHPSDRARTQAAFEEVLNGAEAFEVEFRVQRPDGTERYVLDRGFPVRDAQGNIVRMAGYASDVTELHAAQEKLRLRAEIDWLTGAVNAGKLRGLLSHELARTQRQRAPLALAIIDVDNFKQVNDRYGHAAGDAALRWIAESFRARLRAADVLGRLGGDEFCVVLPDCAKEAAAKVLSAISQEIATTPVVLLSGESIAVTVSIGVTATLAGALSDDTLLRQADEALYQAKHNGRNQVCCAQGQG